MQVLSQSNWNLDATEDSARRPRLLGSLAPEELIARMEADANEAAARGLVEPRWEAAEKRNGFSRVEALIPLSAETFDLLFNGRMGYRAQYYISPEAGRKFNVCVVRCLIPAIWVAVGRIGRSLPANHEQIERSLQGPHSKIWFGVDWAVFRGPEELRPARWVEYWARRDDKPMGLIAPLPAEPMLDLKGTWISEEADEPWLPDSKKDRDDRLYLSGWT